MITYAIVVLAFAFLVFVLAADSMNPFAKPSGYIRRSRWRYGRRVGEAALMAGIIFILLQQFSQIAVLEGMAFCLLLFAVSWGLIAMRFRLKNQL